MSHPPLVAHVRADPLPARKSQTQRSDIWRALGSQGIFRRPEADMPGILGVAEPKKLGGQWRVNQKKVAPVLVLPSLWSAGLPFPQRPMLRTIVYKLWFP